MSSTGTPYPTIVANITSLSTLHTHPDEIIAKSRLETKRILSQLHTHSVKWAHHIVIASMIETRTTRKIICGCSSREYMRSTRIEKARSMVHVKKQFDLI
jgi:hypothetical protein